MKVQAAFRKFITNSGIPLSKVASIAEISPESLLQWWNQKTHLDVKKVEAFIQYYGFTVDQMLDESLDISLFRKRFMHQQMALPEVYAANSFSYVRSSAHILRYLRLLYGQKFVDELLIQMQIHPCYFENFENRINLLFFVDLLNTCKKLGFTNKDIQQLSRNLFLSVENTSIHTLFKNCRNYEEVFQAIEASTRFFDDNFEYKFSISKNGFELKCKLNESLTTDFQNYKEKTDALFFYRSKLFGSMPLLCGYDSIQIDVKSCISRGDRFCHYRADFPRQTKTTPTRLAV